MIRHIWTCFWIVTTLTFGKVQAKETEEFYSLFTLDPQKAVASALQNAEASDKPLLLIIGADWCHDSRALAGQLQSETVKQLVDEHYSLAILDAGWLRNLSGVLTQFGHPAYFGTPTMMVIDADSRKVVNFSTLQRWQSAHNESADSLKNYLSDFMHTSEPAQLRPPQKLVDFEYAQAQRLYHGYSLLGPLMQRESTDKTVNSDDLWKEVRQFRNRLQSDLVEMYQQNESSNLVLPEYPNLSFE
ncbi:thioredoxin family protein [Alteromonas aestuariivivens]|uniref:Thioredoxin family protein n=1 Tax=Alteromonas aestuariivivens TaxID=1938339 RepID=A0A3D8M4F8_9ALTE|nr:thioredoxin family protein [Alteromonas aestuariivivens]RDV24498.1 thioredoxin family protein [Alteromonas aestuariivivens]